MSAAAVPEPVADRDSRDWWAALDRHELVVQRCGECSTWRWPPRALCNRCGSLEWRWEPVSGRGTIASWIVNHHAFGGDRPSPYVVVLVRLAEADDVLMPGAYAGPADGHDLAVGVGVLADFEDEPDGLTRVCWHRRDGGDSAAR